MSIPHGTQAIVGSVCPAQLTDALAVDYGYRPTINAILSSIRPAIATP